jgi:5'(3')-deoxyribonucleotidase
MAAMRRIAIDMDEVLADTLGALIEWSRARLGTPLVRADFTGKDYGNVVGPAHAAEVTALLTEGSFFGDLPLVPGAVEAVQELARRDEVFVVSAATQFAGCFTPKLRWLERHFPFVPATRVVFCGDKAIVDADWLVDDNVHLFPRFRGQKILFDTPLNAGVTGYPRARSWGEVLRLLEAAPAPRPAPRAQAPSGSSRP